MTAAAADRILSRYGDGAIIQAHEIPMGASATIYRGTIVSLDQSGNGFAGTASLVRTPIGVATESKVNGAVAGAKTIRVEKGAFGFVNSSGDDAITAADVGQPCYVVDDQTVSRTSANSIRPFAGRVVRVEASVIYVEVGGHIDPTVVDILLEAAADLSSSQFLFVEADSNGDVTVCNAAGEHAIGVLQNAPASGAIAIVRVHGPSRVIAGGTVAAGAKIATTSAGKSKAAVAATGTAVVLTDVTGAALAAFTDPPSAAEMALLRTLVNQLRTAAQELDTALATGTSVAGSYCLGLALTAGTVDAAHSIFVHPMGAIPTTAA